MSACGDGCSVSKKDTAETVKDRVEYKADVEVQEEKKVDVGAAVTGLVGILGENLLGKKGNVSTTELQDKDVIGLYFSAHWCPPCLRFTPRLSTAYTKLTEEHSKPLEIVFVSIDKTIDDYQKHYEVMPWLAMQYKERRKKDKLTRLYGIENIPCLVLINPLTGECLNSRAKEDVVGDIQGVNFPWFVPHANTCLEFFRHKHVILHSGNHVTLKDVGARYIVLLFSAKWCQACKVFAPAMKTWYAKFHPKLANTDRSFEVIFVSADEDKPSFEEWFKAMSWCALEFDKDVSTKLGRYLKLGGMPAAIVVDTRNGKVVSTDQGRGKIATEKDETAFPWPSQINPCGELSKMSSDLDMYPCLILWLEEKSKDEQADAIKVLSVVANEHVMANAGRRNFSFLYATEKDDTSKQLRSLLKLENVKNDLTLVSLEEQLKYSGDGFSVDGLRSILRKFDDESLDMEKL